MVSMERKMTEVPENERANGRRILWMALAGFAAIMVAGAIAGFVMEHRSNGGSVSSPTALVIVAGMVAMLGGLAYSIWRNAQQIKTSDEPLNRREKLNQQIVIGCGIVGGMIGLTMAIGGDIGGGDPDVFSNGPIVPSIAVLLAVLIGFFMPVISWYWHNHVIDEQESDAYKSGALLAIYAYWTISPVWWILWRGGMVAAPDGVAIFMITIFTALAVWSWKKYR